MTPPRLTALFHNSPTLVALLATATGPDLAGDLLVECAHRPGLSFALNLEIPTTYPGIAGLLSGTDIATLAHSSPSLPAPIILAAGTEIGTPALRGGLMRLLQPDPRMNAITLLVPIGDAALIGASLAVCGRFALAWDITEFPHQELIEFARWISAERLIDRGNFAGIFPYATRPIEPAHENRIKELLAPLLRPGASVGIMIAPSTAPNR